MIKRDTKSPVLFLNSDNSKYMVAKTLPRENEYVFEYGIFGESPQVLDMLDLLISIDGNDTIKIPIMSL